MALETGTYISDLVATNPTSGDPVSQADDHMRLIKSTVKASFPNINAAVTATPTQLNRATGSNYLIVDRVYSEYTTSATLTTLIPLDDTIPQITEGTQILTVSITPKSVTNRLRVRFQGFAGVSTIAEVVIAAAFHNGGSNAFAASGGPAAYVNTALLNCVLEYEFVPGATSAQTIAIRVGGYIGNIRMNGNSSSRQFGGTARSTLIVEEIAV